MDLRHGRAAAALALLFLVQRSSLRKQRHRRHPGTTGERVSFTRKTPYVVHSRCKWSFLTLCTRTLCWRWECRFVIECWKLFEKAPHFKRSWQYGEQFFNNSRVLECKGLISMFQLLRVYHWSPSIFNKIFIYKFWGTFINLIFNLRPLPFHWPL